MGQIGQNILKARKIKGLSQEKIAELLAESRSTYAEWEGDIEPKASTLLKISEILEVSIFDLLGKKDPKISSNLLDLSPEQLPGLLYGEIKELVKATQQIAKNTKREPPSGLDIVQGEIDKGKPPEKGRRSKG